MKIELNPGFVKRLGKRVERFQFEVGILDDTAHRDAKPANKGLSSYAGGPVRKMGKAGETMMSEVAKDNADRIGVDYIRAPFQKRSSDILKFTETFFKMIFRDSSSYRRRATNLIQAIVRNPILRGDYGPNSAIAQKWKTFDRNMIDTGQLFKAIKARISKG